MRRCAIYALGGLLSTVASVNADPLPVKILTCSATAIAEIGPRLEGAPNSGSTVIFRNGGSQVSYSVLPVIRTGSKVGDHVFICLVYIPHPCPPGDNRGRMYTTTNLRTLESWTLPDSEHSCGGA